MQRQAIMVVNKLTYFMYPPVFVVCKCWQWFFLRGMKKQLLCHARLLVGLCYISGVLLWRVGFNDVTKMSIHVK